MKRSTKPLIIIILLLAIHITTITVHADCPKEANCDTTATGLTEAEILAYPEPNVEFLTVDADLLNDRWYQQVTGTVDVFDAPNGNVTGTLSGGFNFITALNEQDGWTRINEGQWIKSESLTSSNGIISQFSGVMLPAEELPYPMAWALINMYPSREPGGNPVESNGLLYRYTPVNLYATVKVNGEDWYQIGVDKWVHQFNVAKILPVERPAEVTTENWVSIDLYEQIVIAYEGSTPVFATLVSSGLPRWPTNEGVFNIYFRKLRDHMSGGQPGDDFYYLEEVPWTMFFDEGRALHGAYWHNGFGYRRSHGCVNLSITDAHWLYNWVADYMGTRNSADVEEGPAVYVYSSGTYR